MATGALPVLQHDGGSLSQSTLVDRARTGIWTAVRLSFDKHPMRHPTHAEAKRRAEICLRWLTELCASKRAGGWNWPLDRALSVLRTALDTELRGERYSPLNHTLWSPDETLLRSLHHPPRKVA